MRTERLKKRIASIVLILCILIGFITFTPAGKVQALGARYYPIHTPNKVVYQVGEKFEIEGFSAAYQWEEPYKQITVWKQKELDNKKCKFLVSDSVWVEDGYAFTQTGTKKMECYYGDTYMKFSFYVYVVDYSDGTRLEPGRYTFKMMGRYLKDGGGSLSEVVLTKKKKDGMTFEIEDLGNGFQIKDVESGKYLVAYSNGEKNLSDDFDWYKKGNKSPVSSVRLANDKGFLWEISCNPESGYLTLRPSDNTRHMVVAAGGKKANGTPLVLFTNQKSTPKKGKVTYTKG